MTPEQSALVRQSLLNTVFEAYANLGKILKTLPFDPNTTGLHRALLYIDDGIVWAKEVILNAPLVEKIPEPKCDDGLEETIPPPRPETIY